MEALTVNSSSTSEFEPTSPRALTTGVRRVLALAIALCAVFLTGSAWASPMFTAEMAERPAYLALAAYSAGLLSSLMPCVYPMVAITVSVFGASKSKSRLHAFGLSGVFLLGLVVMFVPLGVVAGMTGKTFGAALSSIWVNVGLSVFFLVVAASMFGAFDLDLPAGLKQRLASAGGTGFWGAFVLGLVCGPIALPCTGPFLYGLLAFIAKSQSLGIGTVSMASYALGLGTPFFFVGAFAMQLPKSGAWMVHVKSLAGIALVVVALYFLGNSFAVLRSWAMPSTLFLVVMGAIVLLGLGLGAVHRSFEETEWAVRFRKGLGIALVSGASFGFVSGVLTPERYLTFEKALAGENLQQLVTRSLTAAKDEGRPVFLDFTASWCTACKEIEKDTFPDERVQQAAGRFVSVQLDMTNDSDPSVERAFAEYAIVGLPTLILLDSEGREVKRFFGDFVEASDLSSAMNAVD